MNASCGYEKAIIDVGFELLAGHHDGSPKSDRWSFSPVKAEN
jgi:hypothetical protein